MYTTMSNADVLRTAIQEGSTELVKVLLNAGVVPTEDALYIACSYGRADIVQLLLPVGLNYRSGSGSSPLHTACKAGKHTIDNAIGDQRSDYVTTVTILVTQAPQLINELDGWNSTPLMVALGRENFTLAKILLNHGVDITNRDNYGFTALLIAVNHECDISLIEQLIQAGSDLDHQDPRGRTPLFHAVSNNSMEIIKVLLQHGADPNIIDDDGYSSLDIAERNRDHAFEIFELIQSYINGPEIKEPERD